MAINQQSRRIGTRLALMEIVGDLYNIHPGKSLIMKDLENKDYNLIEKADFWEYEGKDQVVKNMLYATELQEIRSNNIWNGDIIDAYFEAKRNYHLFLKLRFLKVPPEMLGISQSTFNKLKAAAFMLEPCYTNCLEAALSVDSAIAQLFFYYYQAHLLPESKRWFFPIKWLCSYSIQSFIDGELDQNIVNAIETFKPDYTKKYL